CTVSPYSLLLVVLVCFFDLFLASRPLHSFPTRRSSDLTRDHSRVFCYFKWFCPLSWKTESRANFDFAEYGFRYEKHNGQKKNQKDRKSTRLNSSHVSISYAVFCLKKKTRTTKCLHHMIN